MTRSRLETHWMDAMVPEVEYVFPPLLSVPEAAKYLGVGRKTLYSLIEWGELTAVKVNGSLRIEKRALDLFKTSGRLT